MASAKTRSSPGIPSNTGTTPRGFPLPVCVGNHPHPLVPPATYVTKSRSLPLDELLSRRNSRHHSIGPGS